MSSVSGMSSVSAHVQFQEELLDDALWAELLPLVRADWAEVTAPALQHIPLEPNAAQYRSLSDAGVLRLYTIRLTSDRTLVGYAVFMVHPQPHAASSLQAASDAIYVAPKHRGRTSCRFLAWCDEQLQRAGVDLVYHAVRPACDYSRLLTRLGYQPIEQLYVRRLQIHQIHQLHESK